MRAKRGLAYKGKKTKMLCKFFNQPRGCDRGNKCELALVGETREIAGDIELIVSVRFAGQFIHDRGNGDVRDL